MNIDGANKSELLGQVLGDDKASRIRMIVISVVSLAVDIFVGYAAMTSRNLSNVSSVKA